MRKGCLNKYKVDLMHPSAAKAKTSTILASKYEIKNGRIIFYDTDKRQQGSHTVWYHLEKCSYPSDLLVIEDIKHEWVDLTLNFEFIVNRLADVKQHVSEELMESIQGRINDKEMSLELYNDILDIVEQREIPSVSGIIEE